MEMNVTVSIVHSFVNSFAIVYTLILPFPFSITYLYDTTF